MRRKTGPTNCFHSCFLLVDHEVVAKGRTQGGGQWRAQEGEHDKDLRPLLQSCSILANKERDTGGEDGQCPDEDERSADGHEIVTVAESQDIDTGQGGDKGHQAQDGTNAKREIE